MKQSAKELFATIPRDATADLLEMLIAGWMKHPDIAQYFELYDGGKGREAAVLILSLSPEQSDAISTILTVRRSLKKLRERDGRKKAN